MKNLFLILILFYSIACNSDKPQVKSVETLANESLPMENVYEGEIQALLSYVSPEGVMVNNRYALKAEKLSSNEWLKTKKESFVDLQILTKNPLIAMRIKENSEFTFNESEHQGFFENRISLKMGEVAIKIKSFPKKSLVKVITPSIVILLEEDGELFLKVDENENVRIVFTGKKLKLRYSLPEGFERLPLTTLSDSGLDEFIEKIFKLETKVIKTGEVIEIESNAKKEFYSKNRLYEFFETNEIKKLLTRKDKPTIEAAKNKSKEFKK
ncbi:MAG: hypothetical protein KBF93_25535 [Leptospiraceae bacterium]|nr:hypothetical protein [Leptospiraceae bacterium]